MSTYNGEKFVRQQIDSILRQVCDFELELWVRDDGSNDQTCIILEEYEKRGQLHWYAGENLQSAKSFLDLLLRCPGYDYYAFADQDDYWYPDKLQKGVNQIKNVAAPAISFANVRLVDGKLQPLGRNLYRKAPHTDFYSVTCSGGLIGCTYVFNNALAQLIQNTPLPRSLVMHDYYLAIVCTLHDGVIVYDDAPCMDYRQHGGNVVGTTWTKADAVKNRIRQLSTLPSNTLDTMAESICNNYPLVADVRKLQWLQRVSGYRKSIFRACQLALDPKPRYNSANMSITLRLAIVLRNH